MKGVINEETGMTDTGMKTEAAKQREVRKTEALSPEHKLKSNSAWKEQKKLWGKASDNQKKDWLYAMVLVDGVCAETKRGMQLIAKYFAINVKELKPFEEVIHMADAARVLKIQRNQLGGALGRDDQVNLKFFMGKQFGYQVNDPAHEGVETVEEGKDITINVMTRENSTTTTTESTTDDAEETPVFNRLLN
jgi:hypothetical protein